MKKKPDTYTKSLTDQGNLTKKLGAKVVDDINSFAGMGQRIEIDNLLGDIKKIKSALVTAERLIEKKDSEISELIENAEYWSKRVNAHNGYIFRQNELMEEISLIKFNKVIYATSVIVATISTLALIASNLAWFYYG